MMTGKQVGVVLVMLALAGLSAPVAWAAVSHKATKQEKPVARLTIDDLPAAAKATLQQELGDGRIVELLKKTKKGQVLYHADVKIDRREGEIEVAPDGRLLRKEID